MSYLQLDSGAIPNFRKAIISFWFRVPASSAQKAGDSYTGADGKLLDGIIPLVVMGKRGKGQAPYDGNRDKAVSYEGSGYWIVGRENPIFTLTKYEPHWIDLGGGVQVYFYVDYEGYYDYNPGAHFEPTGTQYNYDWVYHPATTGDAPPTDPSFIGLDCRGGYPSLVVNFESNKIPEVHKYYMVRTSIKPAQQHNWWGGEDGPNNPGDAFVQGQWAFGGLGYQGYVITIPGTFYTISDTTHWVKYPSDGYYNKRKDHYEDFSSVAINDSGAIRSTDISVEPDLWHHVLVSVEMDAVKTRGVTGPFEDPRPFSKFVDGYCRLFVAVDDVNYTEWGLSDEWVMDGDDPNAVITESAYEVAGSRSGYDENDNYFGPPTYELKPDVPAGDKPLGIPGTAEVVDNIYQVEMAEFYMWTGKSVDTADEGVRRAFVDRTGAPVPPKVAGKMFGKPKVSLHGTTKWILGDSAGSAGDFDKTGWIDPYKPDPHLRV